MIGRLLFSACVLAVLAAGACGGPRDEEKSDSAASRGSSVPAVAKADAAYVGLDVVPNAGTIDGVVQIRGPIPELQKQAVTQDPTFCGRAPRASTELTLGPEGGVAGAVVTLAGISRGKKPPSGTKTAVVDQSHCAFLPHVQAVASGAKLVLKNSDPVSHNVHAYDAANTSLFNLGMPLQGMSLEETLSVPGLVRFKCDAHAWMLAFVFVSETPYFAVTDAAGRFTLTDVPPGTYRLLAWHELLGRTEAPVDAARFPDLVFDCIAGAEPIRFRAAITALWEPRSALEETLRHPDTSRERFGFEARSEDRVPERQAIESAGTIAGLVATAARSEDPGLRAAAQLLSPVYGRALDVKTFSRDVVSRPELASLAATALMSDRSLSRSDWMRLFSAVLVAARGRTPDPGSCMAMLTAFGEDEEREPEPYCVLLMNVVQSASFETSPGDVPPARSGELMELTRSRAAPAELRLFGTLGRGFSGQASAREILELWNEPELSRELRLSVLQAAGYRDEGKSAFTEAVPALVQQLREGRLSAVEENAVASAIASVSPAEIGRLAVERLLSGKLRLPDSEAADTWLSHVEASTVSTEPRLRDALKTLLSDETASPRAASLLAKSGDQAALAPLVFALKTGCFG